jgi:predicted phosphate transport protein (TIGR00153 family)
MLSRPESGRDIRAILLQLYKQLPPKIRRSNMLGTLLNLFGRSPFAPLQSHIEKVSVCVHLLANIFDAIEKKDYVAVEAIANEIAEYEHQADLTRNRILRHLPKSLYLPINRSHIIEILQAQDEIADVAKDVAVLVTLKPLDMQPYMIEEFKELLQKNISTFNSVLLIIKEMHELLESSFGGIEAEKVRSMVEEVSFKEHEVDLVQRKILKKLFHSEDRMSYTTFHLWQKICEAITSISNLSEVLAFRVRLTLEVK